jgi:hypothetical protein
MVAVELLGVFLVAAVVDLQGHPNIPLSWLSEFSRRRLSCSGSSCGSSSPTPRKSEIPWDGFGSGAGILLARPVVVLMALLLSSNALVSLHLRLCPHLCCLPVPIARLHLLRCLCSRRTHLRAVVAITISAFYLKQLRLLQQILFVRATETRWLFQQFRLHLGRLGGSSSIASDSNPSILRSSDVFFLAPL